jgi:hypothetical protein
VIINPIPITAGMSGICLYKNAPANAIRTIPAPAHIAYVMPIGIVLRTSVMRFQGEALKNETEWSIVHTNE